MSSPIVILNKFISNILNKKQKNDLEKLEFDITKEIIKKICPDIPSIAELSKILSRDINDLPQSNIKQFNIKQILNAISTTNQILYGTLICSSMIEIKLQGVNTKILLQLAEKYKIIWPWSLQYDSMRLGNNRRLNRFPLMIIFPKKPQDIIYWIQFVRKYEFTISIRSGGHNYEYFSGQNQVILDLSDLQLDKSNGQIQIDANKKKVIVAPGIRLGILYNELSKHKSIIAGGICPSVCIGGLVAGGGIGYTIRRYDFACDNLLEADVVLANGNLITVNNTQHNDLFRSIKGAGQNFGVIVKYTLKTHPIINVVYFQYSFDIINFSQVMIVWQQLAQNAPDNLSGLVSNTLAGLPIFIINGMFISQRSQDLLKDFNNLIFPMFFNPLKIANIKPNLENATVMTFLEAESLLALEVPMLPFYKIKNNYFFDPLTIDDFNKIANFIQKSPFNTLSKSFFAIQFVSYGGAVKKIPASNSILTGRNSIGWIQLAIYYDNQDETEKAMNYINNAYNIVSVITSKFADPNAPDLSLDNYLVSYYGNNVPFLKFVKNKYDPTNLFNFAQSIPLK